MVRFEHERFYSVIGSMQCLSYRKIPKISPGAYFCRDLHQERLILWRETCVSKSMGLALQFRETSLNGDERGETSVVRRLPFFALFYFVFEGNFPSTSPRGAYVWRDDLTEGFSVIILGGLYLKGLIHGGAYFRNFTVLIVHKESTLCRSEVTKSFKYNLADV